MFYTIENSSVLISENAYALERYYSNVYELPQDYVAGKYIVQDDELVPNPDWEEQEAQKEKMRIQELFMTRSDFFDGTIQAWGIGEDELLTLIQNLLSALPIEDVKKLMAINNFKNALNFYRKHDLFKILVNIPIQITEDIQIIITNEHLDRFFDEVAKGNKQTAWQYLPQPVMLSDKEE